MTARRRALLAGGAISALYLLSAAVSAHLDPLASAPVLDGLAPPPLYRWVDPPPPLASVNEAPEPAAVRIGLDPVTGSAAGVFPTPDLQADIALAAGAIRPHGADTAVRLTITPLAPVSDVRVPEGVAIAGNVYRIVATYLPSRARVDSLRSGGQVVLAYPLLFTGVGFTDAMLRSSDARTWTAIPSTDSVARQLVHAPVDALGYFAVGQTGIPAGPSAAGSSGRAPPILLGVASVVVGIALVVFAFLRGRSGPSTPRAPRRGPGGD